VQRNVAAQGRVEITRWEQLQIRSLRNASYTSFESLPNDASLKTNKILSAFITLFFNGFRGKESIFTKSYLLQTSLPASSSILLFSKGSAWQVQKPWLPLL
jgi:hypothetical protein